MCNIKYWTTFVLSFFLFYYFKKNSILSQFSKNLSTNFWRKKLVVHLTFCPLHEMMATALYTYKWLFLLDCRFLGGYKHSYCDHQTAALNYILYKLLRLNWHDKVNVKTYFISLFLTLRYMWCGKCHAHTQEFHKIWKIFPDFTFIS